MNPSEGWEVGSEQGLAVLSGQWDLRLGYHPSLASQLPLLSGLAPFPDASQQTALQGLELPVGLSAHGHHVVRDAGYIAAATPSGSLNETMDEYPLAPVFVRDLCGRTIHTGLLPLPAAPSIPIFPSGCHHLPASHAAARYVENALFLSYRRVECAAPVINGPVLAGQPELTLRALIARPQQYPYKLRPDTFYADGWRLPQVVRVFARAEPPTLAQAATEEFMQRWAARPSGQDYETFYDANEGETWFEELFQRGCTVIPTLEAYNGRYHVEDDYTASAVDPGRAVHGLHEIIRREPSNLIEGTILAVEEPGWVTATLIHPAKVVVSDGSGFQEPEAPVAQIPNLALPHARLSSQWGAVWLPTHPQHFAEPALWDWDASGHFVQTSGPLWDPLHYTYTCTSALVRAVRKPLTTQPGLYALPETLKARFHPVVPLTSYDTLSERTAQQRAQDPSHPLFASAIDLLPLMQPVAAIGYHPLPWALEYELDPAHLPVLNPRHRVLQCPPSLQERIAPLATLHGVPDDYLRYHMVLTEAQRLAWQDAVTAEQDDRVCDENGTLLPQQWQAAAQLTTRAIPSWLPEMSASHLAINVKRLFAARTTRQALQAAATAFAQPSLPATFFQYREAALAWRRLRYRLFTKYPATWQQACLEGLNLATAEGLVPNHTAEEHAMVRTARSHALGVVAVPQGSRSTMPLGSGGDLPFRTTPANLGNDKRVPSSRVAKPRSKASGNLTGNG